MPQYLITLPEGATIEPYNPEPEPQPETRLWNKGVRGSFWSNVDEQTTIEHVDVLQSIGCEISWLEGYRGDKGGALYASNLLSPIRTEFDSFAYGVPIYKQRGIAVGVLFQIAKLGHSQYPTWNLKNNLSGIYRDWLDFRILEARQWIGDVCAEIVGLYDIDEVLLDFTRWHQDFYPRYELSEDEITDTVRIVSESVKAVKPTAKITASPHCDFTFTRESRGQDILTWLQEGYCDYITPMTYTTDSLLQRWLDEWAETPYFPERIIPRLAVVDFDTMENLSVSYILNQIQMCYTNGADGMTLWQSPRIVNYPALVSELQSGGW